MARILIAAVLFSATGCTLIFGDPLAGALPDGATPDLASGPAPPDLAVAELSPLNCNRPLDAPDDDHHCGPCDLDCATLPGVSSLAYCSNGTCQLSCVGPKSVHCGSDPRTGCDTDVTTGQDCGGCGVRCPMDEPLCDGQACVAACAGGTTLCGTSCVNPQTDLNNCGSCGQSCNSDATAARHESWSCLSGSCSFGCQYGYLLAGGSCTAQFSVTYRSMTGIAKMTGANSDLFLRAGDYSILHSTSSSGFVTESTSGISAYDIIDTGAEVLAGGGLGMVLRRDAGGIWVQEAGPVSDSFLRGLASGGGVTYTVTSMNPAGTTPTALWRRTGPGAWTQEALPNGAAPGADLLAVTSAGDLYVLAADPSLLYRKPLGGTAALEPAPLATDEIFVDLTARGSDVWAEVESLAGTSFSLLHKSGAAAWQKESSTEYMAGIAANDAGDLFGAGDDGNVVHYSGGTWAREGSALRHAFGVWISPTNEVYAIGNGGLSKRQ